jgi:hypothetical protein
VKKLWLILIVVLLAVPLAVHAQESVPDNACYEGGSMEGNCTTEWHWTCGWYLARYEVGIFSRGQVPQTCQVLLAPQVFAAGATLDVVVCDGRYVVVLRNSPYADDYDLLVDDDNFDGSAFDYGTCSGLEIHGNDLANIISGGSGRDLILGYGGNDVLSGGDGRDRIRGGDGADTINGDGGNDILNGNGGADTINGGQGADEIDGDGGNDILNGNGGNDTIEGGNGNDTADGGNGTDTCTNVENATSCP